MGGRVGRRLPVSHELPWVEGGVGGAVGMARLSMRATSRCWACSATRRGGGGLSHASRGKEYPPHIWGGRPVRRPNSFGGRRMAVLAMRCRRTTGNETFFGWSRELSPWLARGFSNGGRCIDTSNDAVMKPCRRSRKKRGATGEILPCVLTTSVGLGPLTNPNTCARPPPHLDKWTGWGSPGVSPLLLVWWGSARHSRSRRATSMWPPIPGGGAANTKGGGGGGGRRVKGDLEGGGQKKYTRSSKT